MRAGRVPGLAWCALAIAAAAGCAPRASAPAEQAIPRAVHRLPVFEGPPEFVAGATIWTGASAARPPLQVADSVLEAWGWAMGRANAAGIMATEWAYFATSGRGSDGTPCSPDRLSAVRLVLDPEDGGRTLALRAEAQFAPGADHERSVAFAREALSNFHQITQDAVGLKPSDQPATHSSPKPLPWPGFSSQGIVPCPQDH